MFAVAHMGKYFLSAKTTISMHTVMCKSMTTAS